MASKLRRKGSERTSIQNTAWAWGRTWISAWHVAAFAGRLGETPAGWNCIEAADLESEFLKQLFLVAGFEGLEPYRAMC